MKINFEKQADRAKAAADAIDETLDIFEEVFNQVEEQFNTILQLTYHRQQLRKLARELYAASAIN